MANYKFDNALFPLNPDQEKAINDLLIRLGQMPANNTQIQKNTQNISQNLKKIKNTKLTTPLDLSRLNQDQFEWLRFNRNQQTKYDYDGTNANRPISLLTDYFSPLHGVLIEYVDSNTDQIDSGNYDDGFIIFLNITNNYTLIANELGNVGSVASGGYSNQYAVNISLSDVKNSGDRVVFNSGDCLMLQYDEPSRLWREIGRKRAKPTANNVSGTYVTQQEEAITADSSAGTTEIRISENDYLEGYQLTVADSGSNANNNNISIVEDSTGNSIATINQNDGYLILYCDGNKFYKISETGKSGVGNFINVNPDRKTVQVQGMAGITVSPVDSNFLVVDATADTVILDFDSSNLSPGSLLHTRFINSGASTFQIYSGSGIKLKGHDYYAAQNNNRHDVLDGEEKIFVYNGSSFTELGNKDSDDRIYGAHLFGTRQISFWRNPLNQASIGSNSGVNEIQNLTHSLVSITGNFGAIDPIPGAFKDGAIITVQFGGKSIVNNGQTSALGYILLNNNRNEIFRSDDQLTLMFDSSGDFWREVGRCRNLSETATLTSDTTVDGEDIVYVDSNGGTFNVTIDPTDVFDKREFKIIDIGGYTSTNAVVILDSNNQFNGTTSANVDKDYKVIDLIYNESNSMWIATNQ